jgi:hypothetical protein
MWRTGVPPVMRMPLPDERGRPFSIHCDRGGAREILKEAALSDDAPTAIPGMNGRLAIDSLDEPSVLFPGTLLAARLDLKPVAVRFQLRYPRTFQRGLCFVVGLTPGNKRRGIEHDSGEPFPACASSVRRTDYPISCSSGHLSPSRPIL